MTNVSQGEIRRLPAVGQFVGQMESATVLASATGENEERDNEAVLEREAFEKAFDSRQVESGLHCLSCGAWLETLDSTCSECTYGARLDWHEAEELRRDEPTAEVTEPVQDGLTVTQIRKAFVDASGRTRSDSYIRAAIASCRAVPGFKAKRYLVCAVSAVLCLPPHALRFDRLRLQERRNMAKPQTELEAEVLEILRRADLSEPKKKETLLRIIRAYLED